jgi:hypothetical protein
LFLHLPSGKAGKLESAPGLVGHIKKELKCIRSTSSSHTQPSPHADFRGGERGDEEVQRFYRAGFMGPKK